MDATEPELYILTPFKAEGSYKGIKYKFSATCTLPGAKYGGFSESPPEAVLILTANGKQYECTSAFTLYNKELKQAKIDYKMLIDAVKCTIDSM